MSPLVIDPVHKIKRMVCAAFRLYDAINARDVSALPGCFAAGVQYQNLALLETFSGTDVSVCAHAPVCVLAYLVPGKEGGRGR